MRLKKHIYALLAAVCVFLSIASFLPTCFASDNGSASEDWSTFRHDAAHTGYSTVAGPSKPNVLWSFNTSGNLVDSSPAIADGKLYVGSENGNIYCLDAKTGQQIWVNFKIDSAIRSSPAVSNGFLYICDETSLFYCLDAQTGKVNWTFSMGAFSSSSPTVANGYVYFSSASEKLYCLDALTGQEKWAFDITSLEPSIEGTDWTTPYTASGATSPAVVDDRVYVGGTNLYCLDASSGSLIWSYPIIVANAPAVSEGKVYFSSWQGDAYCLDAETGTMIWQKPDIGRGYASIGPAVAYGRVYFGGLVYCLDTSNGEEIWRYSMGDISANSPPIVAGSYAYFCCNDDYTYCVDALTGEYVWKGQGSFGGSPAVVDGVLYIGGDSIRAFSDFGTNPTLEAGSSQSNPFLMSALIVMLVAVLTICIVVVLAYLANREVTAPRWKKYFTMPVTLALIVVILVSSVAFLYVTGYFPSTGPSSPEFPQATFLWQTEIEDFATSMVVADGKVFITAGQAEAYAYNAQDGKFIWNWSGGYSYYYGGHVVKAYQGSVYVSSAAVYRLNETNGKIIQRYEAASSLHKGDPSFTFGDGKIFVEKDGLAVYDVDSGGLYWKRVGEGTYTYNTQTGQLSWSPTIILGALGTSETNRLGYVYILGGSRVDVNNGKTLWDTGHRSDGNLVVDDKVVFWNFWSSSEQPNTIHCVDALVGRTLWDFDIGFPVYEPIVHDGLLIFGARDGYLYALNLTDGSMAWKIQVDVNGWIEGNNLPAEAKSLSDPSASAIVVDEQTGAGVWGFLLTQRQIEGINGNNLYVGAFCSFDPAKGTVLRRHEVQSDCNLSDNSVGLAPGKDVLYLTAGLDLWAINKATGDSTMLQRYEHHVLKPVLNGDTVYIAADLHLSAYK